MLATQTHLTSWLCRENTPRDWMVVSMCLLASAAEEIAATELGEDEVEHTTREPL